MDLDRSASVGGHSVNDVEREPAHEVAPCAIDVSRVSAGRFRDPLTRHIEFGKECHRSREASFSVPHSRCSGLRGSFGVKLEGQVHGLPGDDPASFTPGNWLDRPIVQLTNTFCDLRLPGRRCILVDRLIEALDQGTRKRRTSFCRQLENLVDQFLRVGSHSAQSTTNRDGGVKSTALVEST